VYGKIRPLERTMVCWNSHGEAPALRETEPLLPTTTRSSAPPQEEEGVSTLQLAVLAMAYSLVAASALMQTAALPVIGGALKVSAAAASSSLYANWLVVAVSTPPFGALADAKGKRGVLLVSLAIVMIGSCFCGAARTFPTFMLGRVLQGLGEGGAQSVPMAIVKDLVDDETERTAAIATMFQIWPVVTICSPALGGLIADSFLGWRAIFLVLFAWAGLTAVGALACLPSADDDDDDDKGSGGATTTRRRRVASKKDLLDDDADHDQSSSNAVGGVTTTTTTTPRGSQATSVRRELARLWLSLRTVCGRPPVASLLVFLTVVRGGVPATMLTYYPFLLNRTMSTSAAGLVIGAVGLFAVLGAGVCKLLTQKLEYPAETVLRATLGLFAALTVAVLALALVFFSDDDDDDLNDDWRLALAVAGVYNTLICVAVPPGISILMGLVEARLTGALSGLHNGAEMGLYSLVSAAASVALTLYAVTLAHALLLFAAWAAAALASYAVVLAIRHDAPSSSQSPRRANHASDHEEKSSGMAAAVHNARPTVTSSSSYAGSADGSITRQRSS